MPQSSHLRNQWPTLSDYGWYTLGGYRWPISGGYGWHTQGDDGWYTSGDPAWPTPGDHGWPTLGGHAWPIIDRSVTDNDIQSSRVVNRVLISELILCNLKDTIDTTDEKIVI